jgi:hypothetical protein
VVLLRVALALALGGIGEGMEGYGVGEDTLLVPLLV